MNLLDDLLGPLATIECRRAVRPRWLVWLRMLAGLPAAGIAVVVAWLWMFLTLLDPNFRPGGLLVGGLFAIELVQIVLALLLSPALVAGAIAGEKDRGTLGLLLSSRLSSRDIVLGRLLGCLAQVGFLAAAGLPACILVGAFCRAGAVQTLLLVGLPAAVALGSGGMAITASTLARRGRDALLTVYLLEVLLLMAPMFAAASGAGWLAWTKAINPFAAIEPLASIGEVQPAINTVALWLAMASVGTAVSVWQLRPAYRRQTGSGSSGRRRRLLRRVPPVGDRPMLWKELYLDNAGAFGAFGIWLTRLLLALLTGGALAVLGALAWRQTTGQYQALPWCEMVARMIGGAAMLLVWLVQWMIGLRALGVIGTERQRATWDAILTSPLEGKEIIVAKTWGSLFGLRWLIGAMILAWTAAAISGEMEITELLYHLIMLAGGGAFMAAAGVGLGLSLHGAQTTRGMAAVVLVWMAAAIVSAVAAWLLSIVAILIALIAWATLELSSGANGFGTGPTFIGWFFGVSFVALRCGFYFAAAAITVLWIASRFDRLAGRMGSWSIGRAVLKSWNSLNEPMPAIPAAPATIVDCAAAEGSELSSASPQIAEPENVPPEQS